MIKKTFYIFSIVTLLGVFSFAKLSFAAAVTLTTTNLDQTSVTLKADNLVPANASVDFFIHNDINYYGSTPTYSPQPQTATATSGTAVSHFTGLSPSGHYVANVNYSGNNAVLQTITFQTLNADYISVFQFAGLTPPVVGVISDNDSIALSVPNGTDVTALVPTIQLSSSVASISPASGVAQNFTNTVTYTVTATDGSKQDYTATVFVLNWTPGLNVTMSPRQIPRLLLSVPVFHTIRISLSL